MVHSINIPHTKTFCVKVMAIMVCFSVFRVFRIDCQFVVLSPPSTPFAIPFCQFHVCMLCRTIFSQHLKVNTFIAVLCYKKKDVRL